MRFCAFFAWILKILRSLKLPGFLVGNHRVYVGIRQRISEDCERLSPFKEGEIEVDESHFGARRVRNARGRGVKAPPVFSMLKRGGKVLYPSGKKLLYILYIADYRATSR